MDIVKSAGGILYYTDTDGEVRFLLIKRLAMSGKIERVAPKGKIQRGEDEKLTTLREIREETGITKEYLIFKSPLGVISLRSNNGKNGHLDKDITYFLFKFTGDPKSLKLTKGEGYIGSYQRFTIQQIISLVYYADLREIIRKAYFLIIDQQKNQSAKSKFLELL